MTDEVEQVSHEYIPEEQGGKFVMRIAKEGQPTVDGRIFDKNSITWRNPPIPLMFIRANDPSGRGGHKASEAVASITEVWREEGEDGFGTVYGRGYFSTDETGQNARQLIKEGIISGVSADVAGAIVEELEADQDENGQERVTRRIKQGEIVAVTCLPIPAFDGTKVSVVASADSGWTPESEWFENPRLTEATPLTVTADGRVFGHVATWGTCHIGYRDRCVTPPRSKSGYQFFNVGQVLTADGKTVNVGRITAGTGHASIDFGAQPAADHYDNTGWAAAYVHTGEDEFGIWASGAISPTATDEQIATIRAASISGDWRLINGALEMVGVLAVNSPGFPVARAGLIAGAQISLVAAGVLGKDCGCGCEGKGDCHKKDDGEEELRINMDEEESFENSYPEKETKDEVDDDEKEKKDEEEDDEKKEEDEDFDAVLAQLDVEILLPAAV